MHYFEVLVASHTLHGNESLTYSYESNLDIGNLVRVPLRQSVATGIVVKRVNQPPYKTKPIIESLAAQNLPSEVIDLLQWLRDYYPGPIGLITSLFLPSNLPKDISKININKDPVVSLPVQIPPVLTTQQKDAWGKIINSPKSSFLIHGDTGTGKTRLYLEATQESLSKKRSVVLLTPEISLTAQLEKVVKSYFSNQILVFHSNLTDKERRDLWFKTLYSEEPLIIIGPRSCLFLPIKNIGLIVMDESHDNAYKQDQTPRYLTSRVAAKLANLHNAKFISGSATPLISDYYLMKAKELPIIRLTKPAVTNQNNLPLDSAIVDIKNRQSFTRHPYLSNRLIEGVEQAMQDGLQSLIFLNRRGTARLVICQNCDWQAVCPNCNIPLTYHGDDHTMRCHTCGFKQNALTNCPVCKSPDIVYKSIGTKSLVNSIEKLFPQAKVQRFDTDNLKDEKFEAHYQNVHKGEVDILVGTQLLIKGLDLPKLGMVGVVAADTSLYFPDYTAEEQTFQLITQVIGRVGRGHNNSNKIVIQTRNPEGMALNCAINKNWDEFYENQIKEREKHKFPPFFFYLKLSCKRKTTKSAQKAAIKLTSELKTTHKNIEVAGPSPKFIEKTAGFYSWQVIVRSKDRKKLLNIVAQLPANWQFDLDPINLL